MKKRYALAGIIPGIFVLDQLSKWAVMEILFRPALFGSKGMTFIDFMSSFHLHPLPPISITVAPFFNLVMVWNKGISFGLFKTSDMYQNMILIGILASVVIGFTIWMIRTRIVTVRPFLAMIVGGAIGNIFDRIRFGGVADFLDFHAFGYHYPAFNVADSAIVLGMIGLIIHELLFTKRTSTP